MKGQRRAQGYSAYKHSDKTQPPTSSLFCANERCSAGNNLCAVWTECPMFKAKIVEPAEPKQSKTKSNKGKPVLRSNEDAEQAAVVEFCELMKIVVVHIPNEGKRSQAYGARMKRLGMKKGFPDLFFPTPANGYHGLMIEMKTDSKSRVSPEQRAWIAYLTKQGYCAVLCYGADEAIAQIKKYFSML